MLSLDLRKFILRLKLNRSGWRGTSSWEGSFMHRAHRSEISRTSDSTVDRILKAMGTVRCPRSSRSTGDGTNIESTGIVPTANACACWWVRPH